MRTNKDGRHLSFWTATSFIVASMIGTGVFTSLGFQLVGIQSIFPLLMLWVIGGIVALSGALTYGELGTIFPRSGGEYHLLSKIMHPSIGFAAGVVSATVGFTAPAVLAAMALGSYLKLVVSFTNPTLIAFIVISTLHYLHMKSVRWGTTFQDLSTGIKVGLIIVLIGFGLGIDHHQPISIIPVLGDGKILMSSNFAIGLVWVSYAYTGWNSVIYIAGELVEPKVNIPKVMIFSTILVMILYLLLNYIFLYSTPIEAMKGQIDVGYLSGVQIFGETGGKIMGLGISIILLSTVSSYVYIGPRIMQIMGEDHWFLNKLRYKNSNNIPINAFCVQLIISILFIVTSSFEQVLMYAGISLIMITILTVLALFIHRYNEPNILRPYKVLGFPFIPILYLLVNIWILYFAFIESKLEFFISLSIIISSILIFFTFQLKRKLY